MMKITQKQYLPIALMCTGFLLAGVIVSTSAAATTAPEDPDTFLTFLEKHEPEDAVSATAYYAAVDPGNDKTTYADWLFKTGFIDDPLTYNSTGPITYSANAEMTIVTHQNIADLGFIRVVGMRCNPDCDNANPDIYSFIENYPTFDDAAARTNRLASVTMERISAADGSNPADKFVVFYAYTGTIDLVRFVPDIRNDSLTGNPFAPDLDGRGPKAIPGLCNTCHGGAPRKLKNDGSYADNGDTRSLFLAMDLDNFAFDPDRPALSRIAQEAQYKEMNQAVLITHRGTEEFDEVAGFSRLPAGHELIEGWYGGPDMLNSTFNGNFVPPGWTGAEELYLESVAPACRACHAQQKRELDFATYEGFMVFEDAHKELVLRIECGVDNDSKSRKGKADNQAVMPLALVTFNKFWEDAEPGAETEADVFKRHLGVVNCDDL